MARCDANAAAICGLFCGTCPFYHVDCDGCLSDRLTAHCVSCPNGFRACAKEHGVTRCFECTDFPCDRLRHFSTQHIENGICHHTKVIDNLKSMQAGSVDAWVEQQEKESTCPQCDKRILWYDVGRHICQ